MSSRLVTFFAAFVLLGLPEGLLGTAWPSIRQTFDRPESALSQLLVAYVVGYLIATVALGKIVARLGSTPTTRLGLAITAAGLATYAVGPTWLLALVGALTVGVGGGTVDGSINAEVALHHDERAMHLLHAAFGVGATLGPVVMTVVLAAELGWRTAFALLCALELGLLAVLLTSGRGTPAAGSSEAANDRPEATLAKVMTQSDDAVAAAPRAGPGDAADEAHGGAGDAGGADRWVARPRLVLASTLPYFALYVAIEVSVGQWSYSVMTESRGVSPTVAGLGVAAYWGGLTIGRIALGALGDRVNPLQLLRASLGGAALTIAWFAVDVGWSVAALPFIGCSLAGVFPALVLLTGRWLPPEMVPGAVGFQLAASSCGSIAAALAFGAIAASIDLEATVVGMVALISGWAIAHLVTERAIRLDTLSPG